MLIIYVGHEQLRPAEVQHGAHVQGGEPRRVGVPGLRGVLDEGRVPVGEGRSAGGSVPGQVRDGGAGGGGLQPTDPGRQHGVRQRSVAVSGHRVRLHAEGYAHLRRGSACC